MDHSPYWIRPDLKPRLRRSAVIGFTLVAGAAALGIGTLMSSERATLVPVITPVAISVPAPNITVPTPEVKITVPPPEPPKPAPKPQPHALAPKLDAWCVIPAKEVPGEQPAVNPCAWDDGFPAISADGALIAMKYSPDYGPRGGADLIIRFIDTKTSRVVRDDLILSIDESGDDVEALGKLYAQVSRRVAPVQRLLDARRFRTLIPLGAGRAGGTADESHPDESRVHAEIADGAVRIIDPATASVVWQGRFDGARPGTRPSRESDCGGWGLHGTTVWWDPATKTVIADLTYRTGGCMCPDVSVVQVQRIP